MIAQTLIDSIQGNLELAVSPKVVVLDGGLIIGHLKAQQRTILVMATTTESVALHFTTTRIELQSDSATY